MPTSGIWKFFGELRPPGPGPWLWQDTRMLGIDFDVDPERVAAWLPFGLRAAKPGRATMLVADYASSVFGAYREVGLILHARIGLLPVRFWAWMIVDNDSAMIFGRDLLGVPKKLGNIDIQSSPDHMRVKVRRHDSQLLDLDVALGAFAPSAPPLMGYLSANVRGAVGVAVPSVVAFTTAEEILEARRATVGANITPSPRDPIGSLQLGEVASAYWYRTNFGGTERFPAIPVFPVSPNYLRRHWALRFS